MRKINPESPLQDEVREMITELNAHLNPLSPPEFQFQMTPEEMDEPDTTVFIARNEDDKAVGCGALKRHGDGLGEVKRMFTRPSERGQGIGGAILDEILIMAKKENITRMVLETGERMPDAWHVYERAGFNRCGPVLDYPDSGWSVFFEKDLTNEKAS